MKNSAIGITAILMLASGCAGQPYAPDAAIAGLPQPELTGSEINAVLRTATIYVKDWDASLRFYTEYLGYTSLGIRPIEEAKSLESIGAPAGSTARIMYMRPVNSRIARPFAGNYLALIEVIGPDVASYARPVSDPARAVAGEVVLAHQVVEIDRIYAAIQADPAVKLGSALTLSGSGASRSFSVIDPNGVRVEIFEYAQGKEPTVNP